MTWCYINGDYIGRAQAHLSVQDRGFRFGDGLFETIACYGGQPYQWDFHMDRLARGLAALRITAPAIEWRMIIDELLTRNLVRDGFIRIAISRGVGSRGYRPLPDITPTVVIECMKRPEMEETPAKLWVSSQIRPSHPSLLTRFKTAQGLSSTLAVMEARDAGHDDALMLNEKGHICETSSANLFWVNNDTLYTPALDTGCLEGSTRAAVLRLSPVPVTETHAALEKLTHADGAFLTNCARGIRPITTINGTEHWTHVHPIIAQLQASYRADTTGES